MGDTQISLQRGNRRESVNGQRAGRDGVIRWGRVLKGTAKGEAGTGGSPGVYGEDPNLDS